MDEELIRVVATAAAGLIVRAMGTAAWRAVRDRWSRLLGRGDSGKEDAVAGQLDESANVLAAADPADRERLAAELEAEWRGALRTQLRSDPDLVEAVRELAEARPPTDRRPVGAITQSATVASGTSVQSGRDTHIGMEATEPRHRRRPSA
jgi:hypothetical protein